MPNADRPRGFEPYGRVRREKEYVAGARIFPGDAVHKENDGKVDPAVASEALLGVAMSYADADGDAVIICDDPDQMYIVQSDSADIDAQTDVGLNFNLTATAGNTTYNKSRQELDGNTEGTTATLPLKLLGIDNRDDNAFGDNVDCIVVINNHDLKGGTGTAGL